MHAEEGKLRVGHRVDQVSHQVLAVRRGSCNTRRGTAECAYRAVRRPVRPRGRECRPAQLIRKSAANSPAGVVGHPSSALAANRLGARARHHARAAFDEFRHQGGADAGIIHDALLRHAQRRHAAHVRFDLAHLLARQPAQVLPARWPCRARGGRAGASLPLRRPPPPACRRSRVESRSPGKTPPSGGCPSPPGAPSPSPACSTGRNAARRCCGRSGAGPRPPLFPARVIARARKTLAQTVRRGQPHDAAANDHYPLGIHERTSSVVYGPTCISPSEGRGCRTPSWYSVK